MNMTDLNATDLVSMIQGLSSGSSSVSWTNILPIVLIFLNIGISVVKHFSNTKAGTEVVTMLTHLKNEILDVKSVIAQPAPSSAIKIPTEIDITSQPAASINNQNILPLTSARKPTPVPVLQIATKI